MNKAMIVFNNYVVEPVIDKVIELFPQVRDYKKCVI